MSQTLPASPVPTYRVLLIGVNHYYRIPGDPSPAPPALHGPIADVDHVAEQLAELGIPVLAMRKIIAPGPAEGRQRRHGECEATGHMIRWHFDHIARTAALGDRVIVFFAGHGTQISRTENGKTRECGAIVPADCQPIFDYELGNLCDRIYEKTENLTVLLDCCFAADLTRNGDANAPGVRGCKWLASPKSDAPGEPSSLYEATPPVGVLRRHRLPGFTAATACRTNQKAVESKIAGVCLGHFTHALCTALSQQRAEVLTQTWHTFWPEVTKQITLIQNKLDGSDGSPRIHGEQNPELLGPRSNCVLGGPPGPACMLRPIVTAKSAAS